ncbi:hypothetical protein T492DRAFT_836003 [Pavlovales sp. CCMP2436]|nr:hypothetical protein T492DRAFT_836003 [Pavlovales sp. CCMP2436]
MGGSLRVQKWLKRLIPSPLSLNRTNKRLYLQTGDGARRVECPSVFLKYLCARACCAAYADARSQEPAVDGERARVLIVELAELSKKLGAELDLTDCFLTFAFADVGTNDEQLGGGGYNLGQLFVTKLSVPSGQTAAAAAAAADASDSAVALVKQLIFTHKKIYSG